MISETQVTAPAKINLTLHVTGRRADGYHLLDSLVAFANVGDTLSVTPSSQLKISNFGQFATGLPTDDRNSVMLAAAALREVRDVAQGASIRLDKTLPAAAGLGGGTSDAAAALKLLADYWNVPRLDAGDPILAALGADVPVCYAAPAPQIMRGIGDALRPAPPLPDCAIVLCNPMVSVSTAEVFKALQGAENPRMEEVPSALDFDGFAAWLARQRNDLQEPAQKLVPQIGHALTKLRAIPAVAHAAMSGSGATCYAIVRDMAAARQVARVVQVSEMGWWVVPAQILR